MATKTDPSADNYNKPDLRQQLKAPITADDKGGKPGQWSARKAQLLTHEYEKAGDGYLSDQRTDQAWQTRPAGRRYHAVFTQRSLGGTLTDRAKSNQ